MALDQPERRLQVVVGADHPGERQVHRRAAVREGERAAVIGAIEHQDVAAPGDRARGAQRVDVGLGARVAKRTRSQDGKRAQIRRASSASYGFGPPSTMPPSERRAHRRLDHRVGMAVQAGGVFAEEVGIGMAVEIPQARALAADDGQRERRVEQDAPGVAAGQRIAGLGMAGAALGVGLDVARLGVAQRILERDVASRGQRHPDLPLRVRAMVSLRLGRRQAIDAADWRTGEAGLPFDQLDFQEIDNAQPSHRFSPRR